MEYLDFEKVIIEDNDSVQLKKIKKFLEDQELKLDSNLDYTIAFYDDEDEVVATGSFKKNILKCIAVNNKYKGSGVSSKIVSELINEEFRRGYSHLFVYTKPKNIDIFKGLGFYEIETVENKVTLLENLPNGINKYCEKLKKETPNINGDKITSVVVNCNPFTLGHRYLIEKASKENDLVHVFVVWEDESMFSPEVRYKLVQEGLKDLDNIVLHKAEDYIISDATFPSYFLKKKDNVVKIHANLDIKIFLHYIVKALNIKRRYVGEEPLDFVTNEYNEVMKEILNKNGIQVIEVPRLENNNEIISASKVRKLFENREFSKLKGFVPESTYNFLVSKEGEKLIKE